MLRRLLFMLGLDFMAMSMFMPSFMPFVKSMQGSNLYLGIIASTGSLITLFWNPIAGSLSDSNGRRKVLIQCLFISLLGNVLMYLSSNLTVLFLARLLCSFGLPVQSLLRTSITDVAQNEEEKSAAFNKIGAIFSVCFMSGALLSGFVTELENGCRTMFLLIVATVCWNLYLAVSMTEPKKPSKPPQVVTNESEIKKAIKNLWNINWKRYGGEFSIRACLDMSYGIMQSCLGLVLAVVFDLKGRKMGYVFVMISVFSLATNVIMLRLKKSLYANDSGEKRLKHGIIIMIITFLGLGFSSNMYFFMSFVAAMAAGRTLLDATLQDILTSKTTSSDKGSVMSAFESVFSLMGLVAPLISGLISDWYGEQVPLMVSTIPVLIGAYLIAQQKPVQKTQ